MRRPCAPIDAGRLLGTRPPDVRPPSGRLVAHAAAVRAAADAERLRRLVEALPGPRSRFGDAAGIEAAETFVTDDLRRSGWVVERRELHLTDVAGQLDYLGPRTPHLFPRLDGANVVATLPGERPGTVVVVAHLDTLRDVPGADDNGSGIAVALELGRLVAAVTAPRADDPSPRRTLTLAFPDFEEVSLSGSRALADELLDSGTVRAAIVLDTVGFRSSAPGSQALPPGIGLLYPSQARDLKARGRAGDFAAVLYRRGATSIAAGIAEALLAVTGRPDAILLRDPTDLPTTGPILARLPFARDFSRSDHRSFWDRGVPAVLLSDTANFRNPDYHRPSDRPETLDYEWLADLTAALLLVIDALVRD